MGELIWCHIKESPWDYRAPGWGGRQLQHGEEEEKEEGGVILEHLSRLPFPPFLYRAAIKPLSLAATSFLLRSEQTEAQETRGEVENRDGEVGGNQGQTAVRLSVCPVAGALVHHMLPAWGSARTKPLQEGRKALRDNSDPVLGLGSAKYIYGPTASPLRNR